ncbi:unnamed protein product [Plutella xylostella]|uniref:(diamondback moth) hypothetical protein n=1 Tax=Plutella xylostella TaxID=51655 RepID=A0A8S4G3F8_PLUXY|nr:unnamed protein product [Plutella xylostella]
MNVADDATRPNYSPDTNANRWFVGPDFLRGPDSEWPAPINSPEESAETYACQADSIPPHLPDISRMYERDAGADHCGRARISRPMPQADPAKDGVLRLDGRISAATASAAAKRPIILDGRHTFTTLLVQREHETAQHANNERVINNLRQKYWILHLRPTVKRVARSCARCMVTRSIPRTPPTGELPRARLDPTHSLSLSHPCDALIGRARRSLKQ